MPDDACHPGFGFPVSGFVLRVNADALSSFQAEQDSYPGNMGYFGNTLLKKPSGFGQAVSFS
jgi:hypothetical protein